MEAKVVRSGKPVGLENSSGAAFFANAFNDGSVGLRLDGAGFAVSTYLTLEQAQQLAAELTASAKAAHEASLAVAA